MRILFISGSLGLGHVTRDLAIAREIRARAPGAEIVWLAGEPARSFLLGAGEVLHTRAADYQSDSDPADRAATPGGLNIFRYLMLARRQWAGNAALVGAVLAREPFDAVIGDETYEVVVALMRGAIDCPPPFVMLYDFIGLDAMTSNPLEHIGAYLWNRLWSDDKRFYSNKRVRGLFIGEPEDVPDRPMGIGLPNRRAHALANYHFVGYVLPFDMAEVADRRAVRAALAYGDEPLVLVTIGGTATGRDLLEICARAFTLARSRIPALAMTLVCGPRIVPETIKAPEGVRVLGYVPQLYRHLAACDLAVTQAGGTTTLELTALRRPFIYVPLEGQCEQEIVVAGRLARQRAGVPLLRRDMTPDTVAELIVGNIGRAPDWPPIRSDGASVVAAHVLELIGSARGSAT